MKTYEITNNNKSNITHDIFIKDDKIIKVIKSINGKPFFEYDWSYMTVKEVEEMAKESGHSTYTFHLDNKKKKKVVNNMNEITWTILQKGDKRSIVLKSYFETKESVIFLMENNLIEYLFNELNFFQVGTQL